MPRQHNPRPSIFSNFMKGSSKGKQPGKQGAMGVLGFMAVAIAISGVAERPAAAHLPLSVAHGRGSAHGRQPWNTCT